MAKAFTPEELLNLVADDEVERVAEVLGVDLGAHGARQTLLEAARRLPRSAILSALLRANTATIRMLGDIIRFLELQGVKLRTTGIVLSLFDGTTACEHHFGPQVAGLLADFSPLRLDQRLLTNWEDVIARWESDFSPWIDAALREGEPTSCLKWNKRQISMAAMGYPVPVPYERVVSIREDALHLLFGIWRTLSYLIFKLDPLGRGQEVPPFAQRLLDRIKKASEQVDWTVDKMRQDSDVWTNVNWRTETDPWDQTSSQEALFFPDCVGNQDEWKNWIRFVEDVLLLANRLSAVGVADLISLEILRDRPRVYEVWVLTQVMGLYTMNGYKLALCSLRNGDTPVWWLNYSRAADPVCRISSHSEAWHLYYQLFLTGSEGANMPDIALVSADASPPPAFWILDPKYSERGAYSKAHYAEVGKRYKTQFRARFVWVCEYFRRLDVAPQAELELAGGVRLLTDVAPDGLGLARLRRELAEVHGWTVKGLLLAIDRSDSFSTTLAELKGEIATLSSSADIAFVFADRATAVKTGGDEDLFWAEIQNAPVGGGTKLAPLVTAVKAHCSGDAGSVLVILTDQQFQDDTLRLWAELRELCTDIKIVGSRNEATELLNTVGRR